jgi:hypothetical protein
MRGTRDAGGGREGERDIRSIQWAEGNGGQSDRILALGPAAARAHEADKGKAKVTVSFPAWKDGKVSPATAEVLVVDAAKAKGEQK